MEAWYRFVSGAAAGIAALFAPIAPMVGCTLIFIGIDFITGTAADRVMTRREGLAWHFESRKAWRTVVKAALALTAIAMAWLIDSRIFGHGEPHTARIFAGFACGVELWSFLENAAQLSEARIFKVLRRYVVRRIGKEAGDEQGYRQP